MSPQSLTPLATQQAIVAEIEAEQALVVANRELIARFEQKIQATLARVGGDAAPATPAQAIPTSSPDQKQAMRQEAMR